MSGTPHILDVPAESWQSTCWYPCARAGAQLRYTCTACTCMVSTDLGARDSVVFTGVPRVTSKGI